MSNLEISAIDGSVKRYIIDNLSTINIIDRTSLQKPVGIIWKNNSCYMDSVLTLLLYTDNLLL